MSASIKLSLLIVALLCSVVPRPTAAQDEELVPFQTVVKYVTNGPRKNLQTVAFKNRDWKKLWNEAHSGFYPPVPPRPDVDFSQHMIIAVSYEYLPDPSHTLAISKVVKTEDGLRVIVNETIRSGRLCPSVPDILVYPLHIIELDRVERRLMRNVQFELDKQIVDCQPPK